MNYDFLLFPSEGQQGIIFLLLSNTFYICRVIGNAQNFPNIVNKAPICAKIYIS